jgi:hypothetical protein
MNLVAACKSSWRPSARIVDVDHADEARGTGGATDLDVDSLEEGSLVVDGDVLAVVGRGELGDAVEGVVFAALRKSLGFERGRRGCLRGCG